MKLKDLKQGEFFTKRPCEFPKENQVWIREGYDKSTKKYVIRNWADYSRFSLMKGETQVYTDLVF